MKIPFVHRVVGFSVRRPWFVIASVAVVSMVLGYFALHIQIDADIFHLVPSHYRGLELVEKYGTNGDTGQLIMMVESEHLFTVEGMQALQAAIDRIAALPSVLGNIDPFNYITFESDGKQLRPVPVGPGGRAPRTEQELEQFRTRLLSDPMARSMVLSSDGEALGVIFPVDYRDDYGALITAVNEILPALERHFRVYLTGAPLIFQKTKLALLQDVPKFLVLSIVVILLVLFLSFRAIRSVLLPLVVVSLGTLWTMGTMRLLGLQLTVVSIMVPPLVLTLGSAYSIHVLNQYYREARVKAGDKLWVGQSVAHINQTILLAALTTIIGFGSLVSAHIGQIRQFGLSTSIGIAYCGVLSLLFFPAVLSLLPPPRATDRDRVLKGLLARFMERLAGWVIRWRYVILGAVVLIAVAFGFILPRVKYATDYMSYYRKKERVIQDSAEVIKRLGGNTSVYITIEGPPGGSGFFLQPKVLQTIGAFESRLAAEPDVYYVLSFGQYLRLINYKLTDHFEIPENRAPALLLSRYIRAIQDSPYGQALDIKPVDQAFNRYTLAVRVWSAENKEYLKEAEFRALLRRVQGIMDSELAPLADMGASPGVLWGRSLALLYISETLSRDQLYSVLVSVALIFLVTAIGFRSLRLGLFSLIPLMTGIMLNFIFMVVADIPFDVVTVMFSSVALGVGIDDSIHLLISYRRQMALHREQTGQVDRKSVLTHTLRTAGRPIFVTSISLVAGLLVLIFSQFMPILYFGVLVSLALFTTTVGALVILPAILSL
jgi:predicted RND superfamily exporter protein